MNVQKIKLMSQSAAKLLITKVNGEGSETSRKTYNSSELEAGNPLNRGEDIVHPLWRHKAELILDLVVTLLNEYRDGFMPLRPERIALIKTVAQY